MHARETRKDRSGFANPRRWNLTLACTMACAIVAGTRSGRAAELCDPEFQICFQGIGQLPTVTGIGRSSEALGVAHANGRVVAVGVSNAICSGNVNCTKAVKFTVGQQAALLPILNDVAGRTGGRATDVALVGTTTVVAGSVRSQAFRAVQAGDETVEPFMLPDNGFIFGKSMSDDGNAIVGNGSEDPLDGQASKAFRWTLSGGTTTIPFPPHGGKDAANGVSPNGVFVVGSGAFAPTAYVYPPPGCSQACAPLNLSLVAPGAPYAVTNSGVVVGGFQQAYRLAPPFGQQQLTMLGNVPGAHQTSGLGASEDAKTVVGQARFPFIIGQPQRPPVASLWHSHFGMRDLVELALENGATGLTGWRLEQANAISTNGLAIAGKGVDPAGRSQGWIITLPDCNSDGRWDATEAPIPSTRTTRSVLDLDGVDDLAELTAPPSTLRITGDLTIEAWLYLHRIGVSQSVITMSGAAENLAENALYSVEIDANGDVVVSHERADLSDAVFTADTNLLPGRWYHLAVNRTSLSPQNMQYSVQVDERVPLVGAVGAGPSGGSAAKLRVGSGTGAAPDRLLDGFVADLRLWNVVRTAAQIHQSMFTPLPLDANGLVAAWPMDESSGTALVETVGANNLVLAGSAVRQSVGSDCNHNNLPDACDADCNSNGIADACEVVDLAACDFDGNGRPDECDAPEILAELAGAEAASTDVFRAERDDPVAPTTFGTMIQRYGRPWKPGTGQTPGGGTCSGGSRAGQACGPTTRCPGGTCVPPPGTDRDPAERLRVLTRDPSCIPIEVARRAINELFAFEMLLGNEAFADAVDPTVGEGVPPDAMALEQVPGVFAFAGVPGITSLMEEELALLRGREIVLPASPGDPINDDPAANANGNYPQFGSAERAAIYNRLRPNASDTLGSIGYRANYGFSNTPSNATASAAFPQGHGDAYGYYLTAATTYLDAFGAAKEEPVPASFSQDMVELLTGPGGEDCAEFDCESIVDDDGLAHDVGFRSVRNMAAAMASRARTANRIVDLTFRRDYREDTDTRLTDIDSARAWGTADWARRGGVGAYLDWAVLNHLLPMPQGGAAGGVADVHRGSVREARILASVVDEMQERVDAAGAGFNPLGLVANVVPFRIIQPGQLLNFLQGGTSSGKSHYGIVRDAAVEAIKNARGILKRANITNNRLRGNEEDFADFEDQVRSTDVGFNNRLIELFGLPSVSDRADNDGEDNDGDGVQVVGFLNDPHDDEIEAGCDGECAGSPDLVNFLVDSQAEDELGWADRAAVGQVQLAMFELRTATLRAEVAHQALASLEAFIQDKAENVALVRQELVEALEIRAEACDDQMSVIDRKEQLAEARERKGFLDKLKGLAGQGFGCAASVASACKSAINSGLGLLEGDFGDFFLESDPQNDIDKQFDLQREELRINCWQTAELTRISNDQTIRALEIELENLIRRTPQAILELAIAETQAQQAFAVVRKSFQEGKRILDERDRIRSVQTDKLQQFRFRDMAFRTFRNQALEQYGAFFDLASRYVMLAARAFAYEYNERDEVDEQMRALYRERLLGTETATNQGLESIIARLDQKRQESDFVARLQKLSLFDHGGDEFSLRKNMLGLAIDPSNDTNQQQIEKNKSFRGFLESSIVQELLEVPAFQQLASFDSDRDAGPAIVLNFSTEVAGRTIFGQRRGTTFGAPANFDTCSNPKMFEFAILLEGVDNPGAIGVDSQLIFAHFLPVGSSMLRSPQLGDCALRPVRSWAVVDQRIPGVSAVYRDGGGAVLDAFDMPRLVTSPELEFINRFPVTQAQIRSTESPVFQDDLAGWSAWNTQWMLAIPGRQFADPNDDAAVVRRKLLILIYDADQNGNPRSPAQNLGIDDIKLRIKAYGKPS